MRLSLSQLHGELSPSMETIAFQDGTFRDKLIKRITQILTKGELTDKAFENSGLSKLILDETGIRIKFSIENNFLPNAGVSYGWLGKNNILTSTSIDDEQLAFYDEAALGNIVRDYKEEFTASVDLATSKVDGLYSRLEFPMSLTVGLLIKRPTHGYSPEEIIADTILHELGHLYTGMVYMAYVVRRSLVLSQIARSAAHIDNYNKRVQILKYAVDIGDAKLDVESLANSKPGTEGVNYQVVLLTEARRSIKSELGMDLYDERVAEQIADQFMVRHGGGAAMTAAFFSDYELGKNSEYYTSEVLQTVLGAAMCTLTVIGIPMLVMWSLLTESADKQRYDSPIDRLMLIRREMYLRLREPKITTTMRQKTLSDIEHVDKMLAGAKAYPNLMRWIAQIKPSIRKYNGQVALQRTLNELGANRAFAVSAMYASMEEDKLVPIQSDTNATDKLVSVLTRISTSFRSDQGGAVALAQEALSRLMQREGEARQQIPAVGQKLLASAEGATVSQPHLIVAACQKELARLETSSSETAAILSSSQNLAAYFYNTGDYLNAVELNQLKRGSCLTDMVFSTEASIQRLGILSRISTAITGALPALIKEATSVAEVGSVACYQDEDSVIQRMSDQLRYICTEASPLATPDNPDMDDLGDAAGGPYPSRVHKLVKSARFSHDRAELGGNVVYRGLSQVKDPATLYLNIGASAKQALIEILPQIKTAVDHLSNTPASTVDAAETALFYERVAKLLSTLIEISEGSAQLLADIRDMTKAIDQAQDFTISLSQLIYPQ